MPREYLKIRYIITFYVNNEDVVNKKVECLEIPINVSVIGYLKELHPNLTVVIGIRECEANIYE